MGIGSVEDFPSSASDLTAGITAGGRQTMDNALAELQAGREAWGATGLHERVAILKQIRRDMLAVADRWVVDCLNAKGAAPGGLAESEEWQCLVLILRYVRLLRRSLTDIRRHRRPRIPGPVTTRADGQVVAHVFPHELHERLLFAGVSGEVWMEPGCAVEEVLSHQAHAYREEGRQVRLALVLGAGNVSMLPVTDLLHKLFVENRVVVLKTNPVNAYLGPLMQEGLHALIERGALRIVTGGAAEGAYLCHHPAVDELHLTGSDRTFEAILFGSGPEGKRRKAQRRPLIDRHFSAELGNVTPVIVVPGPWSEDDVRHWAVQTATWFVHNAGFNCVTPRILVQHRDWPCRQKLLQALGEVLLGVETREAYYPGARQRYEDYVGAHPRTRTFGEAGDGRLPWTLIPDVDAGDPQDICFRQEAFCSLMAETALEAPDVPGFIDRAVEFANDRLWGTLSAALLVHPRSLADPRVAAAAERAVADLRYGMVCVNSTPLLGGYMGHTVWGGFPGSSIYDVQSGIGFTLNALMFERPQKTVVRGPFRRRPDPLALTSRRAPEFARRLAWLEAAPSAWRLAGLVWTALRS